MYKCQGFTQAGNTQLLITGASGVIARRVQGSFPGAILTVYQHAPATAIQIFIIERAAMIVTVEVASGSNFIAGETVTIAGVADASFNGTFTLTASTLTTISYVQVGADAVSYSGTAQSNLRLGTIYADRDATPKANPFVTPADGTWFFYAPNGYYDLRFSGGGLPAPYTIGDVLAFDPSIGDGYFITDLAEDFVSVRQYGALGDGRRVFDAAMVSGQPVLASTTANFTNADVGKPVVVEGAWASAATLTGTIIGVINPTAATLSVNAINTVLNTHAIWASDDTDAIQAALDAEDRVYVPTGVFGFSTLRLRLGNQIVGAGASMAILSRMSVGLNGPAIAMHGGEAAQGLLLTDLAVLCNQIGANCSGIELGTEGPEFRFANDSYMDQIRVMSASGFGIELGSNVGRVGQVWVQNFPGQGTPAGLSAPDTRGFRATDTMLIADLISVEGRFEGREIMLNAGASRIHHIQVEPVGVSPAIDCISIGASFQTINDIFAVQWSGLAITRRDLIRIEAGVQAITIGETINAAFAPVTVTNMLNDLTTGAALAYDANHSTFSNYHSDQRQTSIWDDTYKVSMGKRFIMRAGTAINAAATLTLPLNGNQFLIVGSAVPISWITTADWLAGAVVILTFSGTPTIIHNNGPSVGTAPIFLSTGQDLHVQDGDMLCLKYDADYNAWKEVAGPGAPKYFEANLTPGVILKGEQYDADISTPGVAEDDMVTIVAPWDLMTIFTVLPGVWVKQGGGNVTMRLANYSISDTAPIPSTTFRVFAWRR